MCPEIDSKIVLGRHYEPVVSRWYHEANLFVTIICGHRTSNAMLQSLIGIVHVESGNGSSTGLSQYKTRELPRRCMGQEINEQTSCLWYARTMIENIFQFPSTHQLGCISSVHCKFYLSTSWLLMLLQFWIHVLLRLAGTYQDTI